VTVTAITGGQGFSVTPDKCSLLLDIRTTPSFDDQAATTHLADIIACLDRDWPLTRPTITETRARWPPYALNETSALPTALLAAAARHGIHLTPKIAGPSNIGNYLAGLAIPATAGFGVAYAGLHAADERFRIDTVPAVQATYHEALLMLMQTKGNHEDMARCEPS
jgi:succinyl-diaminopimelate desuccinylase